MGDAFSEIVDSLLDSVESLRRLDSEEILKNNYGNKSTKLKFQDIFEDYPILNEDNCDRGSEPYDQK